MSDPQLKVSCIIPFYNEGDRVLDVLKEVSQIKEIDQIICVDDGSDDKTYQKIQKQYPQINLIILSTNQGKTEAVKAGVRCSKYQIILLLDADLVGVKPLEIKQAIKVFKLKRDLGLLVLVKKNDHLLARILRWNVVISGDRLIRKSLLKEVLNLKIKGYQLEVAMNQYMIQNHSKVAQFPVGHTYYYMFKKRGFVKGLVGEIKLTWNFISYIKPWGFLYQILFFCRHKIRHPGHSLQS